MIDITFDRILSIGINYVGTQSELRGCINDLINLSNATKAKSRVIMTELATDKTLIPTRANIIAQIKKFVTGVKPGMNLLFQYSGHGSNTRDRDGSEEDKMDETICPLDYDQSGDILDDELRVILCDALPQGSTLWCVMDCCRSGTVMDLAYNYTITRDVENPKKLYVKTKATKKSTPTKGQVICLSGCQDAFFSSDAFIGGKPQGAMTWGLLTVIKSLQSQKIALTYRNIMRNLLRVLKQNKYDQVPQFSTGKPLNLETLFATSGLPASRHLDRADSSDNEGDKEEEENDE
jgi:hypothetical protein